LKELLVAWLVVLEVCTSTVRNVAIPLYRVLLGVNAVGSFVGSILPCKATIRGTVIIIIIIIIINKITEWMLDKKKSRKLYCGSIFVDG
jgi:hypothetical protein